MITEEKKGKTLVISKNNVASNNYIGKGGGGGGGAPPLTFRFTDHISSIGSRRTTEILTLHAEIVYT